MPVGKLPLPPENYVHKSWDMNTLLYDLDKDEEQTNNLAGTPAEKEYEELLRKALEEVDCPPEQFKRVGLD